jgi:hypothetical protein
MAAAPLSETPKCIHPSVVYTRQVQRLLIFSSGARGSALLAAAFHLRVLPNSISCSVSRGPCSFWCVDFIYDNFHFPSLQISDVILLKCIRQNGIYFVSLNATSRRGMLMRHSFHVQLWDYSISFIIITSSCQLISLQLRARFTCTHWYIHTRIVGTCMCAHIILYWIWR